MLLASLSTTKIFEVQLRHLNGSMTHLTRKLEHFTAALQVKLCKSMAECMSRDAHTLQATLVLYIFDNRAHTVPLQRFATPAYKERLFIWGRRRAVLMDILPKQFTHLWMYAYLTLFTALAENLHIAVIYVCNLQTAQLRETHTSIQEQQEHHIVAKSQGCTCITCCQHRLYMLSRKGRNEVIRRFRLNKPRCRVTAQYILINTPIEQPFDSSHITTHRKRRK